MPHQVTLFDAHAMLAGEAAAGVDAQLQDIVAGGFGTGGIVGIVGVEEDQRCMLPSPAWKTLATRRP